MRTGRLPIHDLYIRTLEPRPSATGLSLTLLRHSDHLLRRFGFAEHLELEEGAQLAHPPRPVADEAWALVRGQVEFTWEDLRKDSPSFGQTHRLRTDVPTLVLVPFGVALRVTSGAASTALVRFSTHEDETVL
jgi:hypothetical protein